MNKTEPASQVNNTPDTAVAVHLDGCDHAKADEHPLITVIVPCYNVEAYLDLCVDSLLSQTYPSIKILLIDDKSTDGTAAKIAMYEKDHPDTISAIFNDINRGTGYTRNLGLSLVRSEEVGFVDPDDWVPPNYFNEMHGAMARGNFDLAVCEIVLRDSRTAEPIQDDFGTPSIQDIITSPLAASSTNKLFKTRLFDGISYPEGIMNEDVAVIIPLLFRARIAHTSRTYYNYFQRGGSTQNSYTLKRLEMFEAMSLARERSKPFNSDFWQATEYHQIIGLLLHIVPKFPSYTLRKEMLKGFQEGATVYGIDIVGNVYLQGAMATNRVLFVYVRLLLCSLESGRFGLAAVVSSLGKHLLSIYELPVCKKTRQVLSWVRHPRSLTHRIGRVALSASRDPRGFWKVTPPSHP